ncbi:hypothetical protein PQ469_02010 [Mucilaginibacter sp. KACC 22773]|jgi:ABC-type nickel/cobalt efflux system permease component RcnA|uniref:hypothetical protein n=1 Tax=Mucilaginibacter sp. KACC 22773 TaxID=3025671 RepID=UPI002366181A|nr:hypothetical protein [Mucilaginibacter sp. KACC 22773]WDF78780.1 hypothetical protein PQ469_02010 [Mucilaginibacter sp. KACC 22773]
MLPDEVYKRRPNHNNTPESITLIIANFIVFAVATQLFVSAAKIGTFFWVVVGALAVYNFFNIRKYREDYNKGQVISYILSLIIMVIFFFVMRGRS